MRCTLEVGMRRRMLIVLFALLLSGCATLASPTPTQVDVALSLAVRVAVLELSYRWPQDVPAAWAWALALRAASVADDQPLDAVLREAVPAEAVDDPGLALLVDVAVQALAVAVSRVGPAQGRHLLDVVSSAVLGALERRTTWLR